MKYVIGKQELKCQDLLQITQIGKSKGLPSGDVCICDSTRSMKKGFHQWKQQKIPSQNNSIERVQLHAFCFGVLIYIATLQAFEHGYNCICFVLVSNVH